MVKKIIPVIFFIFFSTHFSILHAAGYINIDNSLKKIRLGKFIEYLEDKESFPSKIFIKMNMKVTGRKFIKKYPRSALQNPSIRFVLLLKTKAIKT
jgi:hypothetical protein